MENFAYYAFCLVAIIIGIIVLKKVAGCLMRTLFFAAIIAVLAALYFIYFKQ